MKKLMLLSLLGFCLLAAPPAHAARVVVGFGFGAPVYVGPPPVCAYGYYPYYPYACAPYGYYGPEWFYGGVFIGAGPWFHGFYHRGWYGRPGFYGRGGYYGRGGFYGRGGYYGRGGFYGRSGFRSGRMGGGFRGGYGRGGFGRGGFHGGGHGGGGFGRGGFHGGGHR